LVLGDLDPRRCEGVFPEDAQNDGKADGNQNVAGNNRRHGHGRPAEAMIEGRYKQQAHEADRGKEHDELLLGLRLRGRPAGQAALQQRRIVLGEIGRDKERRAENAAKNSQPCQ